MLRKRIIEASSPADATMQPQWLNIQNLAEVEMTSEDASHPIESALLQDGAAGWRASAPGKQTIRLLFDDPQHIERIRLSFVEHAIPRTQEYVLRWSPDRGRSFREIVRQQWNFSPTGTTSETENHEVALDQVTILELSITPNIGGGNALASLAQFRVA